MKNCCLTIVLFFVSLSSFSQGKWKQNYKRTKKNDALPHYTHTIRISPLSLIDPLQPSLTLGSEWRFGKNTSVGLDVSTLFTTISSDVKKWGYIIKPSLKLFLPSGNNIATNFYIEPDVFWKRQFKNESNWLGKGVENGVPAYFQFTNYTIVKDVIGANIKIGTQSTFKSKNMMFEFYLGFGVRKISKFIKNEPDALLRAQDNLFFSGEISTDGWSRGEPYWGVSFPMGIRISYIIK